LTVRKNLALTGWLLLPILVFSGLVWWIFVTASRPRLMDEAAVGPGAGDTGGANALGEWLAGRDPNAVEAANIARRQGAPVDPFAWPGGTEVVVRAPNAPSVVVGWVDPDTRNLRAVALRRSDEPGVWSAVLREFRPPAGTPLFLAFGEMRQRVAGGRREVTDTVGRLLTPAPVPRVVPQDTPTAEPLRLELTPPG
jgi:hypothetical protein